MDHLRAYPTSARSTPATGAERLRGDNPGNIPNYTSYFSSYFRPAPQTSSTAAEVAAPDAPWSLPAGATKRWEFRLGRGNKQKNVNVYLRTLPLVGGQSSSLEVKIVSTAELGEESLDSRFYSSLPTELIDPDKFEAANGHPLPVEAGDAIRPMLLRLTLNDKARLAELLSVPTLKVDFINHSSWPIVIEDVFVHATQGTAVPNLVTGVHSP